MAKQISAIKFIGTMGNLVGSKGLDGKVIIREKAASVNNPQTQGQMDQRARFKLASQVSGMLDKVAKTALKANGIKETRRGTTNKELMQFINVNNDGVAILNHEFNLVKHPVQTANELTAAVSFNGNIITGTLTGVGTGELVAKTIMVYDHRDDQWKSQSTLDTNASLSIGVTNAQSQKDDLDVYFYAIVVTPSTSEGRARLNNLISQDSEGNYKVNPNRLDNTNYDYTRTLVASSIRGTATSDSLPADPAAAARALLAAKAALLGNMNLALDPATAIGLRDYAAANNITTDEAFINLNTGAVGGTIGNLEPDYEQLKLSTGRVTKVALGEVDFSTPLTVSVAIDDDYYAEGVNYEDDKLFLVVYSKTLNEAVMGEGTRGMDTDLSTRVPGYWQGSFVEVYAFLQGKDSTECSETIYCGSGRIA